MADAWAGFRNPKRPEETVQQYCERSMRSFEWLKANLQGQPSLGMFQSLSNQEILAILSKVRLSKRRERPLRLWQHSSLTDAPEFALTCKLFHVLAAEPRVRERLCFLEASDKETSLTIHRSRHGRSVTQSDETLAAFLPHFSCLEELHISPAHTYPLTLDVLRACPHLRSIRAHSVPSLEAFAAIQTLVELEVHTDSGAISWQDAAQTLAPCSSLRRLEWHRVADPSDPSPLLALTRLTHLSVHQRQLPCLPAHQQSELPSRPPASTEDALPLVISPNLRELVFSGNDLPPMPRIWAALPRCQLRSLWLRHLPPLDVLLRMPHLEKLTVSPPIALCSDDADADHVVQDLVSCLLQLHTLNTLILVDWCSEANKANRQSVALQAMLKALPRFSTLRALEFAGGMEVTSEGAAALCAAMMQRRWQRLVVCDACRTPCVRALMTQFAARRGITLR